MKTEMKELLRRDFGAFLAKTFSELGGSLPDDGPYLKLLIEFAEAVARGDISRGLLNVPPRHGKTQTCSIALPAWMLGRNPSLKVMLLSYGETLSHDIAEKLRRIMKAEWYRAVFPTWLSESRYAVMDFATRQGGHVFASSFGGAITGRGADLIIVDDPVKISDAGNLDIHEKVAQSMETEILSRLNNRKKGQVLIVGHRLHPEDLSGRYEGMPGWTKLSLPFIADEPMVHRFGSEKWRRKTGELLRPDGFSDEDVEVLRTNPNFQSLYQQNPSGVPWDPLTEEHFLPYGDAIPEDAPLVVSIDPAQASHVRASFWVAQAWAIVDDAVVLVDQLRDQTGYAGMVRDIPKFISKHRPSCILIEQTSGGMGLTEKLGHRYRDTIVEIPTPTANKLDRLHACIEYIHSGKVQIIRRAVFREEFVDEVTSFPNTKIDDQVDAMTQFLAYFREHPGIPERASLGVSALATAKGIEGIQRPLQEITGSNGRVLGVSSSPKRWYR